MTQAFNLGLLANKVNSSGNLDASTGLVNATPIANGGTNLTTLGASGNMLIATSASAVSAVEIPSFGFKNRLINGAMVIDQRNAGASVSTDVSFPVDRFVFGKSGSQTFTGQRSTTAPSGFINSVLVTIGTGGATGATDRLTLTQAIEGYNILDLAWGSASASTITISFWVRSSLTGTFGVALRNSATNRSYVASYTINSANTFEQKTITVTGDTSGTWLTDNSAGIYLSWDLGVGSTYSTTAGSWQAGNYFGLTSGTKLSVTSGATFYITGVQLEKGSTATSFDYRPYSAELAMCQRYYQLIAKGSGFEIGMATIWGASDARPIVATPVTLRSTPTVSASNNANDFTYYCGGNVRYSNTLTFDTYGFNVIELASSALSGTLTTGFSAMVRAQNGTSFLAFSAEL